METNSKEGINKESHKLHKKIGDYLKNEIFGEGVIQIADSACGGAQRIPLFLNEDKSRGTQLCNVDYMIIKDDKVKVIIEIEESNIKPVQILGKLMVSAIAQNYTHHTNKGRKIAMADDVVFIQILDTKTLKEASKKKGSMEKY